MRYTRKALQSDIDNLNNSLKEANSPYHLSCEGRNGYTAVDVYENEKCIRNLACGTPKECLAESRIFTTNNT